MEGIGEMAAGGERMYSRAVCVLLLAVALPCLVSYEVYYGFGTNYTADVFHEEGFREQYESGVYRYRVLGRHLLLGTHSLMESDLFISRLMREKLPEPPAGALALDARTDPVFYASYFVLNTFFLMMCGILMYLILAGSPVAEMTLKLLVAILLIGLTEYVVCPYDTLSYALVLLTFLLILRQQKFGLPMILLALAASTLARETAVLAIPFFIAHNWEGISARRPRQLRHLALMAGVFAATYLLLRVLLGFDSALWQNVRFLENISSTRSIAGFLALPVVAYPLTAVSGSRRKSLVFLAACLPYWLAMLVVAETWETRLWVPVWLGLLSMAPPAGKPCGGQAA